MDAGQFYVVMRPIHLLEAAMNKRGSYEPQKHFFVCIVPLLAADVVRILITYYYSVDRGMWPLILVVMFGVSFFYSGLVYFLAHLTRHYPVTVALLHHSLLAAVLAAHTLAFYVAKPDWLAVNNGSLRLTTFQTVVFSDWAPWSIYALFYLILGAQLHKFRRRA